VANKKTNKDLTKEERIKKEIRRLRRIFKKMDDDTKKATQSLLENAAFMAITLEDLQEVINREGVISEYQNGANQWGTKKSPEVEVYNTMIKHYMSIIKQLTDLLPKDAEVVKEDDGFEDFINSRAD
jgi:predicted transcriptional regulator